MSRRVSFYALRFPWKTLAVCFVILAAAWFTLSRVSRMVFAPHFSPLAGRIIVIDPGHGGTDQGAIGAGGTVESELNLQVAKRLRDQLWQVGAFAVLTRETEEGEEDPPLVTKPWLQKVGEDLGQRTYIAEACHADLFISIHGNSFPSKAEYGAQTFYQAGSKEGRKLAEKIQGELIRVCDPTNPRGVQARDDLFVLNHSKMPAVIVEVGFLSHAGEEQLLRDPEYQEKLAWAIQLGIMRYYGEP